MAQPDLLPRLEFKTSQTVTNDDLSRTFGGREGGIRFRGSTSSRIDRMAIIQTSTGRHPYHEQRDGDVLLYMGQGKRGDQRMSNRNLALAQHLSQKFPLYAFEGTAIDTYRCLGRAVVEQISEARAPDEEGKDRRVYIFTLRLLNDEEPAPVNYVPPLPSRRTSSQRQPLRGSDIARLRALERELAHTTSWSDRVTRSRALVDALKELYEYRCQLCGDSELIPTIPTLGGRFYVEVHHLWGFLEASSGDQLNGTPLVDRADNCIVACPYHHALLHYREPRYRFDPASVGFVDETGAVLVLEMKRHDIVGGERYRVTSPT
jgi:hypothetical protein